jgi:hypothetical protein
MPKCQNAKMPKCQNAKMPKCQKQIAERSQRVRQSREAREAHAGKPAKQMLRASRRRASKSKDTLKMTLRSNETKTCNNYDMNRANINFYFGFGS